MTILEQLGRRSSVSAEDFSDDFRPEPRRSIAVGEIAITPSPLPVPRGTNFGGWENIYTTLQGWLENPPGSVEDGILPPTWEAMVLTFEIVIKGAQVNMRYPDRVVPDGNGGVTLESKVSGGYQIIQVEASGREAWITVMREGKVIKRVPLEIV